MRKPNIIIIVSDALRHRNLSLYGYNRNTSPYLERLAKLGVVFEDFYSTTDQTDPSFTTIMSGRYPIIHGIMRHGPDVTEEDVSTFYKTKTLFITDFLKEHGYINIGLDWLGRWHNRSYNIYGPASSHVGKRLLSRIPKGNSVASRLLRLARSWNSYHRTLNLMVRIGYSDDLHSPTIFRVARELIRKYRSHGRPVFMLIHIWDTHTPFDYLPSFLVSEYYDGSCSETVEEMSRKIQNSQWRYLTLKYHLKGVKCVDEVEPRYNAAIRYFDHFLEGFVEGLIDLNVFEDSILVVTGDHGENLIRNGIFIGHGGLFQRVIRVPLVIVAPGVLSGGRTVKGFAQHVDILPTVLGLAGVDYGKYYVNGLDLLDGINTGRVERDEVLAFSSTAKKRYAIVSGKYKLVYSPTKEDSLDKYGIWSVSPIELYDLSKDDDDMYNIAQDHPDIVNDLVKRLNTRIKQLQRDKLRLIIQK